MPRREKRQYKCDVTNRVCPFNNDVWLYAYADHIADDNCPINAYEHEPMRVVGNMKIFSDWCIHLIPRE